MAASTASTGRSAMKLAPPARVVAAAFRRCGSFRLRRAAGWFGADSLVTVLLTDGYGTSVASAAVVLSAAPLASAATSLLRPRLVRGGRRPPAVVGLSLTAAGAVVALRATSATRPA